MFNRLGVLNAILTFFFVGEAWAVVGVGGEDSHISALSENESFRCSVRNQSLHWSETLMAQDC